MFLFPKMLSSFEDSATAHLRKNSVQGIKRETTKLMLCSNNARQTKEEGGFFHSEIKDGKERSGEEI